MPRQVPAPLSPDLLKAKKGEAAAPGERATEKRIAITFRITEAAYERLRKRAFETRSTKQALVDDALDRFLANPN